MLCWPDLSEIKWIFWIPWHCVLWFQHVDLLHADGGLGFQKEYDYIQASIAEKKGDFNWNNDPDDIVLCGRYWWMKLSEKIVQTVLIAGKLEDSNNLTWVDGYQNKNAYVMTNIYR